jgi:tyrosine-specific transport protein
MKQSKFIGGMLLIIGTTIGGGMLALPVSQAPVGFMYSILFMMGCWLIMTLGALLILDINLLLPPGANMVSMAKKTLGIPGEIITWLTYLMLLYNLLSAYISGGSDVFLGILHYFNLPLPEGVVIFLFTLIFGAIVYQGIQIVDYCNRGLMFAKLGIYLLLIVILAPYIHLSHLTGGDIKQIPNSIMILIASFGFASIVPSLRDYFQDDIASLRKMIIVGSFIPLICYTVWILVIMGVVSNDPSQGLLALTNSNHATSELTTLLNQALHNEWTTALFRLFSSICMLTAFLAVSIGLFDFIADGLTLKKQGIQKIMIALITFLPPLLVVLFKPGIYLNALSYAGICCVILLLLLPALMSLRYSIQNKPQKPFIIGGNITYSLLIFVALYLIFMAG